jgi:hypothetical protein
LKCEIGKAQSFERFELIGHFNFQLSNFQERAEAQRWRPRLDLIASGEVGKPCERLTAPCASATRVISRMTDSVKREALSDGVTG